MAIIHGKKTSIKDVQAWAISLGGKLLSKTYENMLIPLRWQCAEGHTFKTTFNHVRNRKQWCPHCANARKKDRVMSDEAKINISCGHQGIAVKNFKGFVAPINQKIFKLRRHNERMATDILYRLKATLRNRLRAAIINNQKAGSAVTDLGCSVEMLKRYLESRFLPGMSWNNWGCAGWHIDHIVPLSTFDLSNYAQLKKACHYTNLQPLWAKDNLRKGGTNVS